MGRFVALCIAAMTVALLLLSIAPHLGSELVQPKAISLSVPDVFELVLTTQTFGKTGNLSEESSFELSSNGSAHDFESNLGVHLWPPVINKTATLEKSYVDEVRNAMNSDELCSMSGGTYRDAGYEPIGLFREVTNLTIRTPCGNRSFNFEGEAMVGVLPHSYAALNRAAWRTYSPTLDLQNITLEVSARFEGKYLLNISAVLWNNASRNFSMSGCGHDAWPVEIVRSNGCTVEKIGYDSYVECAETIEPGTSFVFNPHKWNASGLAAGRYTVMASPFMQAVTAIEVAQDLEHINQAPRLTVKVVKLGGENNNTYALDSSGSCDEKDLPSDLKVRWDWSSDGKWDVDWTSEKNITHDFTGSSGYNFTVEVKDSDGLVATASYAESVPSQGLPILTTIAIIAGVAAVALVALLVLFRRKPTA